MDDVGVSVAVEIGRKDRPACRVVVGVENVLSAERDTGLAAAILQPEDVVPARVVTAFGGRDQVAVAVAVEIGGEDRAALGPEEDPERVWGPALGIAVEILVPVVLLARDGEQVEVAISVQVRDEDRARLLLYGRVQSVDVSSRPGSALGVEVLVHPKSALVQGDDVGVPVRIEIRDKDDARLQRVPQADEGDVSEDTEAPLRSEVVWVVLEPAELDAVRADDVRVTIPIDIGDEDRAALFVEGAEERGGPPTVPEAPAAIRVLPPDRRGEVRRKRIHVPIAVHVGREDRGASGLRGEEEVVRDVLGRPEGAGAIGVLVPLDPIIGPGEEVQISVPVEVRGEECAASNAGARADGAPGIVGGAEETPEFTAPVLVPDERAGSARRRGENVGIPVPVHVGGERDLASGLLVGQRLLAPDRVLDVDTRLPDELAVSRLVVPRRAVVLVPDDAALGLEGRHHVHISVAVHIFDSDGDRPAVGRIDVVGLPVALVAAQILVPAQGFVPDGDEVGITVAVDVGGDQRPLGLASHHAGGGGRREGIAREGGAIGGIGARPQLDAVLDGVAVTVRRLGVRLAGVDRTVLVGVLAARALRAGRFGVGRRVAQTVVVVVGVVLVEDAVTVVVGRRAGDEERRGREVGGRLEAQRDVALERGSVAPGREMRDPKLEILGVRVHREQSEEAARPRGFDPGLVGVESDVGHDHRDLAVVEVGILGARDEGIVPIPLPDGAVVGVTVDADRIHQRLRSGDEGALKRGAEKIGLQFDGRKPFGAFGQGADAAKGAGCVSERDDCPRM